MAKRRKQRFADAQAEDDDDLMPSYRAEPTLELFHADKSFFRGVRGPIGSGKSVGCCAEIMGKALQQRPFKGVRRSRWGVIRNTYGELKSTTIQTWNDWFGPVTRLVYGHPIWGYVNMPLSDGTALALELVFLSLDKEKDVRKLKSLELTGIWLNEASEIPEMFLQMATGRVNRFPSKARGGFNWSGVIADTNSCNVDNWWYRMAEEDQPENYAFYAQPPAMLFDKTSGQYTLNPLAENIQNHTAGADYYFLQLPGKPKEWVKVFILNQYGSSNPGNLVYSDYDENNHCGNVMDPGIGHLIWSHDFNFTPLSSVIMQRDGDRVYAVDEIVLSSAVAEQAAIEFCERYKDHKKLLVKLYGDASGHVGQKHGHASDYVNIERVLRQNGFRVQSLVPRSNPSIKDGQNSLRARICDALDQRNFFVNPKACPMLDKGLRALRLKEGSTFQEEDAEYQHITTAVRYYTAVEFPIKNPTAKSFGVMG